MLPETRQEPGKAKALTLAVLMHALLALVLFFGVQWKRSAPDVVEVELWAPRSAPAPEPVPETKPEPRPEPPKPEIKPEPPKPTVKPDIVEKVEKKPPPKPEPKPEPPKPKPEPPKPAPKPVPDFDKMLEQETKQTRNEAMQRQAANAENELRAAANKRGLATWGDKIRAKIRSNVILPANLQGNPEAVFEIRLLPTGEVMQPVKLKRSSGNPSLDSAIERAILKSSPLPKPDDPSLMLPVLEIKYRPIEE